MITDDGLTKNIGIWLRVSTEDQARGDAPEHHEERARYYAKAKGWNVREVYHLEGVSGKSVLDHPEARRMIEDVKRGYITGLVFSKLARLARSTKELLEISDIFREFGADLISLQESIDTTSPAGRLFYTLIAAMAQWEREEIAERVAASVPVRARLGKPLGGAAPYGYRWEGPGLKIDEKEALIRRLMYDLFMEHKRKKTVARILNDRGYRTRKGAKWTDTTIDRLLTDPIAKGERRANYTRSTGDGKHWELKPENEWVVSSVDQIVSAELWNQVNAILSEQKSRNRRPARRPVHLFSGVTLCHCGHKMYVPSNSPKYICRQCKNKIGVDDLEAIFQEQLKTFLLTPEILERYLGQADEVIRSKSEQLEILVRERQELTERSNKVLSLYLGNKISADGFARVNEPIEARYKELEGSIPELQAEIDILKINYLSSNQIKVDAKDLFDRWDSMNPEQKRSLVELVTEKIVIHQEDIEISLVYLPGLENVGKKAMNTQGFMAATSMKRAG